MLLGAGSLALHWPKIIGSLKSDPAIASMVESAAIFVGIALGFSFAVSILLWYFVARKASNIAKWIYVAVMGFGAVSTLASLNDPTSPTGLALAISLVSTTLTALSIFFLFRPDARVWFGKVSVDPRIFD
jgi:hypothetical protein